jgi:cobalt/nickel transport system permease protein
MMLSAGQWMHIPDGFLTTLVALVLWALVLIPLSIALNKVGKRAGERQVPLMGVLAAAIFAGQMLNFTVAGGTSGHLMGAALATILLGPWAAMLVLTTVVGVQALIFQDGGLLALGANILNMAVIGVMVSHFVYRTLQGLARGKPWGMLVGGFLAAWVSIVVAALAAGLELAVSGTSPANLAIPAMGGIHMLIGIGEGLITVGALTFLKAARRDLLQPQSAASTASKSLWVGGLVLALLLALLSPLASAHPDGLEWVARQNGFLDAATAPVYALIPDYLFPGITNEALATIVAGLAGVLIVLGVVLFAGRLKRKKGSDRDARPLP